MNNDNESGTTSWVEGKIDDATEPAAPEPGAPRYGTAHGDGDDRVDALKSEQRREGDQAWAGPGVPASTDGQAKGLVIGSLLGGAIGLALLLPLAFIPISGLALGGRLIVCAIAGALAGGTAGAMYFGGRVPELQGETVDADGRPSVGSTPRDPNSDERGR
jgi:hypothetical protein